MLHGARTTLHTVLYVGADSQGQTDLGLKARKCLHVTLYPAYFSRGIPSSGSWYHGCIMEQQM